MSGAMDTNRSDARQEAPDQLLADRMKAGDQEALRLTMERYGGLILRTAFLLLRDRHWAEDVSQEVFIRAFRSIDQLHNRAALRPWLTRITINECRQRMRMAAWKRLVFGEQAMPEQPSKLPGPEASATELTLAADIQSLPYKYREVVVLHYYHDLSIEAICGQLREKPGTIKSRLARARAMLKHKLEGEE